MEIIHETPNRNRIPGWVDKIKNLIQEQYYKRLSLEELSKEAGVHPVHLSRQFPKYFSVSLHYYVTQVKIQKATLMLGDRSYRLGTIASRCGFTDASHFNRCFRKITGLSPSQYRRKIFETVPI